MTQTDTPKTSPRQRMQAAKALAEGGDWAEAELAFAALRDNEKFGVQARRRRIEILMRQQRWAEAREDLEGVIALADEANNRDVKRAAKVFGCTGSPDLAAIAIEAYTKSWIQGPDGPAAGQYVVLTAAAPKTGSTSLSHALSAAVGYTRTNNLTMETSEVSAGVPSWEALQALNGYGIVNHCHLSSHPEVLEKLLYYPHVKVVVHLRDPITTMESAIDMMLRQRSPVILSQAPEMAVAPRDDLIAWAVDVYADQLLGWMARWLAAVDAGHPSILGLSTLDEVKRDGQDAVARRIWTGVDGVTLRETKTEAQRTGQRLEGDEKVVLSEHQRNSIMSRLADGIADRFGWTA